VGVCDCGRVIEQPSGPGRRRKMCLVCSPVRDRPGRRAPVIDLSEKRKPENSLLAALERQFPAESGVHALMAHMLAAAMGDAQRAVDMVALSKERRALLLVLEGSSKGRSDPLDETRRRRDERLGRTPRL
jgi:hypothetical protein